MKKSIAFGAFSNLLAMLVSMFGNVLLSSIVVHKLTSFYAGIWFSYLGVIVLLSFCNFGTHLAMSQVISLSSYKHNLRIRILNLYSTLSKLNYIFALIALVIAVVFFRIVIYKYCVHNYIVYSSFAIFSFGFAFRLLVNPALAVMYGTGKVGLQANLITMSTLIGVGGSIVCLLRGGSLIGMALCYAIAYLCLYIIATVYVWWNYGSVKHYKFCKQVVGKIFKYALNSSAVDLSAIMLLQIPSFVIVHTMGPSKLPPFAVIRQVCSSILSLSVVIGNTVIPFIGREASAHNISNLRKLFHYTIKYSTALALCFALFVLLTHREIAYVWLHDASYFNLKVLIVMLVAIVLEANQVAITKYCVACGYTSFVKVAIAAATIVTLLSIGLVHLYGILGAALAVAITQLVTNNWYSLYVAINNLNINWRSYFAAILPLLGYGWVFILSWEILIKRVISNTILGLIIAAAIFSLVFVVVSLFFKGERSILIEYSRKLISRPQTHNLSE